MNKIFCDFCSDDIHNNARYNFTISRASTPNAVTGRWDVCLRCYDKIEKLKAEAKNK